MLFRFVRLTWNASTRRQRSKLLASIDGLDSLGPESTLFIYDVPNVRRCDLEAALPAEVLERSEFRNIGECDGG